MAQFDYYAATVPAFPRVVTDALVSELPGAASLVHGRGRHGYHHSANILTSTGDTLATVLHGGHNAEPHAVASGATAGVFAEAIRKHWPDAHRVSRVDSCEDLHGDFGLLMSRCRLIGEAMGVKGHVIMPDNPEDGATYYLGATTSAMRLRLYEKGKQLRAGADDPESVRTDWVRAETQWRPSKEARTTAAGLSPGAIWGVSRFTHRIALEVLLQAPERVTTTHRLPTTFDRRNRALVRQSGAHLLDLHRLNGSTAEGLGRALLDLLGVGADADA